MRKRVEMISTQSSDALFLWSFFSTEVAGLTVFRSRFSSESPLLIFSLGMFTWCLVRISLGIFNFGVAGSWESCVSHRGPYKAGFFGGKLGKDCEK